MKFVWVKMGNGIRKVPISKDPIRAFRGLFKGLRLTEQLLKDRQEERARERRS